MTRDALEIELLDWMRRGATAEPNPERFERLALELFAFQFRACAPYARLCESLGRSPERVSCVEEIPAVPTGAFKEFALRCFDAENVVKTFRTSGTTSDRRGELHLDTLALYEASLLASLQRCLLPASLFRAQPLPCRTQTISLCRPLVRRRLLRYPSQMPWYPI